MEAVTHRGIFGPLRSERLVIRPMESGDAADVLAYRGLPGVWEYQTWEPRTIADVEAFIARNAKRNDECDDEWVQLSICLDSGDQGVIGDIGVHFLKADGRQAEVGYTLSPGHRGRGYATEAVATVIGSLFGDHGMHRVIASVDPGNTPSIALLERLGMRREAHFVRSLMIRGQWVDDVVYAVLRDEWKGLP